jgi:hypothetical protein
MNMLDPVPSIGENAPTTFSHVKPQDTAFRSDGLRDFFLYRDLGISEATKGRVIAQLVIAHNAPERAGTAMKPIFISSSCYEAGPNSCTKTSKPWSAQVIACINARA